MTPLKVLSFDAYFHESVVPTISREGFRIRPVKVFFYLEDDSIQVIEPTLDNSGIPQGTSCLVSAFYEF